jgi:hypothetical protein
MLQHRSRVPYSLNSLLVRLMRLIGLLNVLAPRGHLRVVVVVQVVLVGKEHLLSVLVGAEDRRLLVQDVDLLERQTLELGDKKECKDWQRQFGFRR